VLSWEDVRPVAEEALCLWTGHPEQKWAKEAWAKLAAQGLTRCTSEVERSQAGMRFVSLCGLYADFFSLLWQNRTILAMPLGLVCLA